MDADNRVAGRVVFVGGCPEMGGTDKFIDVIQLRVRTANSNHYHALGVLWTLKQTLDRDYPGDVMVNVGKDVFINLVHTDWKVGIKLYRTAWDLVKQHATAAHLVTHLRGEWKDHLQRYFGTLSIADWTRVTGSDRTFQVVEETHPPSVGMKLTNGITRLPVEGVLYDLEHHGLFDCPGELFWHLWTQL